MAGDSHPDGQDGPIPSERHSEEQNVTANRGRDAPQAAASVGIANDAPAETPSEGKHASTGESQDPEDAQKDAENPKPSKAKLIWGKVGLDVPTVVMMFKASIPPLVGIAFYQSPAVAATYGGLGYLVPILTVLSMCILPRAKFLQNLVFNILGICIGSAVGLLGMWSALQARIHTTPPGRPVQYNASQSAICAIWLVANIWLANMLRAKIPALQFPVIVYSIFTSVSFTFGPLFQTFDQAESLIKELLIGFLTSFAISTAVSLVIFPVTSRTVVFSEMTKYIGALKDTIKAQSAYLQSLENSDMFRKSDKKEAKDTVDPSEQRSMKRKYSKDNKTKVDYHPEAKVLKEAVAGIVELHGKLYGDIPFAKRETAYGKLGPKDLDEIFKLFQAILIPLIGMTTITDIFERFAESRGWLDIPPKADFASEDAWEQDPDVQAMMDERNLWNETMKILHEPFAIVSQAMEEGLDHAGLLLELVKLPKIKKAAVENNDVEAKAGVKGPGDEGFTEDLQQRLEVFYSGRGETLRHWARQKSLTRDKWDAVKFPGLDNTKISPEEAQHFHDQQQLYLILYMEFLLYSTGTAILNLIRFAEAKLADGTLKKKRLIYPSARRIRKWIISVGKEDSTIDNATPDSLESGTSTVYMGAGFGSKKDPEHLPATTGWQKFGNMIRTIPQVLRSAESAFGVRVALATMTVGIVAFLESTQIFFQEQRLVWAMIIIAIGMTITAGQSVSGFFARTGGTALSMIFSITIWYIVDEKTPAVIVMLWFFIFVQYYFFLKFPRFIPVWLMCIVTQVLIIGYELQVEVLGIAAATANQQPYYPIYELAPYRLACVAGGCFVAFIWTIFPYPLTDRSWLRKDLGNTLHLLANYYNVIESTIGARLRHAEGDMEDKNSPGRQLEKVRHKIFGKLLLIIPSLRQHLGWQQWEPAVGGKFPKEKYEIIINRSTNILHYLSLISFTTKTLSAPSDLKTTSQNERAWIEDLAALLDTVRPTTHSITSTLILLSASVSQGTALPPYMQSPEPYNLLRRLEQLDKGILDSSHVEEPGYAAFAVTQVASNLIADDLRRLVEEVKDLVGEVDFSFKVVNSETSTQTDSTGVGNGKGKQD